MVQLQINEPLIVAQGEPSSAVARAARPPKGGGLPASFLRLPAATKELAVEAAMLLALARFLVIFVPLRRWRHRIAVAPQESLPVPALAWKVAWVVRRVADVVPFSAACLPQAMAAQWMLRWRGVASQLAVGVRRQAATAQTAAGSASGLAFHAWLLIGGQCVVGCKGVGAFMAFPPFESAAESFRPPQ